MPSDCPSERRSDRPRAAPDPRRREELFLQPPALTEEVAAGQPKEQAVVPRVTREFVPIGNLAVADELISDDYEYQDTGVPDMYGVDGFRQVTAHRTARPDLELT